MVTDMEQVTNCGWSGRYYEGLSKILMKSEIKSTVKNHLTCKVSCSYHLYLGRFINKRF